MKTLCCTIAFFALMIPCLGAHERGVAIRLSQESAFEAEPGEIVTTAFQVTNTTSRKQQLFFEVKCPQGWTLIAEDPAFCLGPNESDVRLVGLRVPQKALAGQYTFTYCLKEKSHSPISDSHAVDVIVLPIRKVEVQLLQAPQFAIAGEDYRASFAVTNNSNIQSDVRIHIASGDNLPVALEADRLQLAPGESKQLVVVVKTDGQAKKALQHYLSFTAQLYETQEIHARATSLVEVLPRTTGAEERFYKAPSELTLGYVSSISEENDAGFQAALSGSGTFDAAGELGMDYFFRGPDVRNKSIFGQYDEYRFRFWTKKTELRLGDHVYLTSPFIERAVYGRGIEGGFRLGKGKIGAYHLQTRWLEPKEKHTAGYVDYLAGDLFQLGLNYLHGEKNGEEKDIASIECQLRPFAKTNIELEYATGARIRERADAYQLGVSSRWNWISYTSRFVHAEPGTPAYLGNRDFASAGLSLRYKQNLNLMASVQQDKRNLNLDPTLHSAPLQRFYKLGADYRLTTRTNFYAYWQDRYREDLLPEPGFRYREKTALLGMGQSYPKMSFRFYAEWGQTEDQLASQSSALSRYKFYAHLGPVHGLTASGYLYSDEYGDDSHNRRRRITAGLNSSLRVGARTLFSLNFQTGSSTGPAQASRDILELSVNHTFHNQSEIRLRGRRISSRHPGEKYGSDVLIEYTIPFSLPIARRKDTGGVTGSVYDQESGRPISNAILKMSGATAITDTKGKFSFPTMQPGVHYLNVSTDGIGLDRIASRKTPMEVFIQGGKDTRVDVEITRSASLTGQVILYRYGEDQHQDFSEGTNGTYQVIGKGDGHASFITADMEFVPVQGMANILVELINGTDVIRCLTNREGRFEFEELLPGKWTVHIDGENLPAHLCLERDVFDLEIQPGGRENILAKLLPRKRPIRIIERGGILLGEIQNPHP